MGRAPSDSSPPRGPPSPSSPRGSEIARPASKLASRSAAPLSPRARPERPHRLRGRLPGLRPRPRPAACAGGENSKPGSRAPPPGAACAPLLEPPGLELRSRPGPRPAARRRRWARPSDTAPCAAPPPPALPRPAKGARGGAGLRAWGRARPRRGGRWRGGGLGAPPGSGPGPGVGGCRKRGPKAVQARWRGVRASGGAGPAASLQSINSVQAAPPDTSPPRSSPHPALLPDSTSLRNRGEPRPQRGRRCHHLSRTLRPRS